MDIFYKADVEGRELNLDSQESVHCLKVMRYRVGDKIKLVDGKGGFYEAVILNDDTRACRLAILSTIKDFEALPYELHIAIAPTKSIDRFEWFIEKATEIGITSITPIICERSERKNIRIDRIEKVMIAAAKQSVKAFFPKIQQLTSFKDWVIEHKGGAAYIAHCMYGEKEDIWKLKAAESTKLLIGPEGDFSEEEVQFAEKHGYIPVSLGAYRLRTETAGVIACSAVYFNHQK